MQQSTLLIPTFTDCFGHLAAAQQAIFVILSQVDMAHVLANILLHYTTTTTTHENPYENLSEHHTNDRKATLQLTSLFTLWCIMSAACVRCLCCSSHVVMETLIFLHVVFGEASEMQGIDLFIPLCIKDALGISCVSSEVTAIRWGEGNATDRRNDHMKFTFKHFDVEMLNSNIKFNIHSPFGSIFKYQALQLLRAPPCSPTSHQLWLLRCQLLNQNSKAVRLLLKKLIKVHLLTTI